MASPARTKLKGSTRGGGAPRPGARAGRTQRVTRPAASTPIIESTPSWERPCRLESNSASEPNTVVSTARRKVGQTRARTSRTDSPDLRCVKT